MRSIEISEETYAELQARARPFEDTPETVIVRLLRGDDDPVLPDQASRPAHSPASTGRAAPGTILSERAYWRPILQVLSDLGGAAPATEVIERVGDILADQLTPLDHEELQTGEIRWRNRAQFARLRMKQRGLLAPNSGRGTWEITSRGRRFLEESRGT